MLFIYTTGWAATYYVAQDGSGDYTSIIEAYRQVSAGDSVIVKPGVYTEYQSGYGIHVNRNGTADRPIVLKSQVKWGAVLDGENGEGHNKLIYITGDYNLVEGFEMRNGYDHGVAVYGNHNRITGNNIHHCGNIYNNPYDYGQDGIYSNEATHDNAYVGNYIHHHGRISLDVNLDHGLYLCGTSELVANNIVVYNCSYGIHVAGYDTVRNMKIYNNLCAFNGRSGLILWMDIDGVDIKNNIFYGNRNYGSDSWDAHGQGVNIDHNLYFGNPSGDLNLTRGGSDYAFELGTNLQGKSPLLADTIADFHLQPGSPAIDAGIAVAGIDGDFEGILRPQGSAWDIGPYEYVPSGFSKEEAGYPPDFTVTVYPGPAGSPVGISLGLLDPKTTQVTIYDCNGKRVKELLGLKERVVFWHREDAGPGMYVVTVRTGDMVYYKKCMLL